MSDDIVARLRDFSSNARKLAENESLNDMYCYAFLRFESLTMEASSEIKILRIHFDMILTDLRRAMQERDEARRRYCFAMAEHGEEAEARQTAKDEGWDCFKEDTDER